MTPTTRGAATRHAPPPPAVVAQDDSDYGSEVDQGEFEEALLYAEVQPVTTPLVLESIEEYNPLPKAAHVPTASSSPTTKRQRRFLVDEDGVPFEIFAPEGLGRKPSVEVEYDERNRVAFSPGGTSSLARKSPAFRRQTSASVPPEDENEIQDDRSPLERFRTKPKKPMSVTDLVSPAWCEQQYWYNLTKYGRVKATPAMKQGSSVHKVLEEQVHKTVPIEVVTKEDMLGLRIWNIIQGLRTLRTTGMTREFEVWAEIEGQVVNGVIDELSFQCPDQKLQDTIDTARGKGVKKEKPLPANQKTMQEFFANKGATVLENSQSGSGPTVSQDSRRLYLSDIKTRGSKSVPNSEVSLRPTYMQISLYHRMLSLLASDSVQADKVFLRYSVKPTATFSDTFIAEIGALDYGFTLDPNTDPPGQTSTQDSVDELLAHNNLSKLWSLMQSEFALTLPRSKDNSSLGDVLRAEFRTPGTGAVIGTKTFVFDDKKLDLYVKDEMAWWKGERATKGVDIEEAFKCRICEFAAGCTWRKEKVEQGLQRAKLRLQERRRSEV